MLHTDSRLGPWGLQCPERTEIGSCLKKTKAQTSNDKEPLLSLATGSWVRAGWGRRGIAGFLGEKRPDGEHSQVRRHHLPIRLGLGHCSEELRRVNIMVQGQREPV